MSFGFVEVITLLLGLSGFGVSQNPRAPSADQALQYAMPDADVVVHVDVDVVVGNNYKVLTRLATQPQIRASPELSKLVRKAVGEIDGFKGIAKATTGLDVTTDIHDATVFLQVPAARSATPNLLITVRGRFSVKTIDNIAKLTRPAVRLGGGAMIEIATPSASGGGGLEVGAIAVTRDGTFLAGTTQLVKDRLAPSWRPPARPASSNLARVAEVIDGKPVFAVALTMSPAARRQATADLGSKNFLSDLIGRHKLAAFSVFHDGIGWTWIDSSRAGLDAMAQMSEGVMELLKAAQIAPRGFAKILMGAIESYRGSNPQIDQLIRRKADILKIVESYTGDGNFRVQITKQPAALRLEARATGKYLSEVVPAGFFLPAGALGWLTLRSAEPMPPAIAVPPTRPSGGLRAPKQPAPRPAPRPTAPRRP